MRISTSHRTTRQLGTALVISAALSLGLSACKSSPEAQDEAAQNQPITLSDPEDLLQTDDTMLAVRVNFGGDLPGAIREMGADENWQLIANLLEDPVTLFKSEPDVQVDLSALDTERPLYVTLSRMGNEDFLDAAGLGLPTRDEEWPTFALYRALLPTDDPALMATQFDQLVADFNADKPRSPLATRSFEGPGFLRVEIAAMMNSTRLPPGERMEQAQSWLNALDLENLALPTAAAFRPTAAYNAFVEADSELAVWTRFDALTHLGILEASMSRATNSRHTSGEPGLARFRMENLSRLATASVLNDPVAAENEDISIHLDATAEGAFFLDTVLTRTSQGARVGEAARSTVELPQIGGSHFLALDWSVDLASVSETIIAPFWELQSKDTAVTSINDLAANDMLARLGQTQTAVPMLTALAQYPMALITTAAFSNTAVPMARAGTLRAFALPQGGQLPVGMAAAMVFDNTPGMREQLQQLLTMGQMALPIGLDAALIERDDDAIELRLALGTTVSEAFEGTEMQSVSEATFELDLNKLGQLRALIPAQAGLNSFDRITFASHDGEGYHSYRIAMDAPGETVARTADNDATLLTAPTFRCRTELAAAAFYNLENLGSDAHAKADAYLGTFSERADRCIEPTHPYAAQAKARLEMAREWASQLEDSSQPVESVY
ncbi:hypothetical protein FRC98_16660 [Lujinxingia vulgaris]|uniref:Lipoprotein n=1 Tax=Lujinxingia vulgaris TaxID=2600176 RepID=A0A5C6X2U8_9DELT|nr:hypothetical protein [Lujinxingia vulgaris]TXD35446.1 hypothetical protein FRC98_16660 [Lujinxingia vulgaris]